MKFDTKHTIHITKDNANKEKSDTFFCLRICLFIFIIIITLQSTLICFLIVFPYGGGTSETKCLTDVSTDHITTSYIPTNSSIPDLLISSPELHGNLPLIKYLITQFLI